MHELSLAESMRELIVEQSERQGFTRVTKVLLEVGELSHVEADAMRFCFESVMHNSPASEADLEICHLEGRSRCPECGFEGPLKQLYDPCSRCGTFGQKVIQGDAVRIKSLEVL